MSKANTLELINNTFTTAWGNTTPIAWQNIAFDMKANPEFVRFNVLFGEEKQVSFGSSNLPYRQYGRVSIQVFTPPNRGAKRALELADLLSAIWRTKQLNGHIFAAPNTVIIGNVDGVYQLNVSVEFFVDYFY